MNGKVKVCVIGCGRAGMIHTRNYPGSVEKTELAAAEGEDRADAKVFGRECEVIE